MAGADPLLVGSSATNSALERYREERAKIARLDRLEREGVLLLRDQIMDGLHRIANLIRGADHQDRSVWDEDWEYRPELEFVRGNVLTAAVGDGNMTPL